MQHPETKSQSASPGYHYFGSSIIRLKVLRSREGGHADVEHRRWTLCCHAPESDGGDHLESTIQAADELNEWKREPTERVNDSSHSFHSAQPNKYNRASAPVPSTGLANPLDSIPWTNEFSGSCVVAATGIAPTTFISLTDGNKVGIMNRQPVQLALKWNHSGLSLVWPRIVRLAVD